MTRLNSARGPAIGHDHTKAVEACQFLASAVSGLEGEPGFRAALAAARAQEAITRSWASERWEPMAHQE
jgi:hypothetical protein